MKPADTSAPLDAARLQRSRCQIIGRSNGSGRISTFQSSPATRSWPVSTPSLAKALFGTPRRPFSVSLDFPPFDGPDYARALEMARASAEYRETRHWSDFAPSGEVLSGRRAATADALRDCRPAGRLRRAHRRSAAPLRAGVLAAAHVVLDLLTPRVELHG